MRELRQAGDDVPDGINARFGGLHPFICQDEAAIRRDLNLVQADVIGTRGAADGDQDLFRLLRLALAVGLRKVNEHAVLVLLKFVDLCPKMHIDAALLEEA